MNFLLACLVYVLIGVALGLGIYWAVTGSPWFFILALLTYLIGFSASCLGSHS